MATVRMGTFPEPSPRSRSVISCEVVPAIEGDATTDYACGGCGVILAAAMRPGQMQLLAFKCPKCGAFSEPPQETPVVAPVVFFPAGIYDTDATLRAASGVLLQGERSDA